MKYYVASGVRNAEKVNLAAAALNAAGHTRTYDWTTHGDVSKTPDARKQEVAGNESRGVAEAELVVLLLVGTHDALPVGRHRGVLALEGRNLLL